MYYLEMAVSVAHLFLHGADTPQYFGMTVTNQNLIYEEMKSRLN
jgi:hypothetical protein